jgi:hypothetical protein
MPFKYVANKKRMDDIVNTAKDLLSKKENRLFSRRPIKKNGMNKKLFSIKKSP